MILTERFWAKVDKVESDCWLWTGAVSSSGYGCWGVNGKSQSTHRLAYEALVGPIPAGMTIDHLCRVKVCVNPAHMEPVTGAENSRRYADTITHCPQNHPYTPENTIMGSHNNRACRACQNDRRRVADDLREWAATNGIQLNAVGPIPRAVKDAYAAKAAS